MVARGANDPGRRERIIAAALEVIGERGVHQTSHRTIAARAGVPLGSLTYYFDGLSDILEQAFASLAARMAEQHQASLESARSREEACAAVVGLICGTYATPDQVRALFEMYSFGNYDAKVHDLCRDWLLVSRANLGLHFTEPTARALDALVEAFPMHQAWEGEPLDRDYVAAVVQALVDRFEPARDAE